MTLHDYDITQASNRKEWESAFHTFLIEYYKPYIVNADKVMKAAANVDRFIQQYTHLDTKLLLIKDVNTLIDLKQKMLSHQSFAMGATMSSNNFKIIVLERYVEFLQKMDAPPPIKETPVNQSEEETQSVTEGLVMEVRYFRSKRNRLIRNQCAERDHYTCQVCGFNFEKKYGERGKEFIEIHHLKPISSYDGEHEIKLDDLVALCSNCHSMIHYGGQLLKVEELKMLIK